MPPEKHQLEARTHPDGVLRWIVTSRTRPEIEHLVDLDAFGGVGRCSCEHFEFRIAPGLRDGQRIGAHRCSHILVARGAFTDAMIQSLVKIRRERAGSETTGQCLYCGKPTTGRGTAPPEACDACEAEIQQAIDDEDHPDTETEDRT